VARTWGYWTVGKLDILRAYLDAFTTATKLRARDRIYLDLFAGGLDNRERMTDEPIESSAQIAAESLPGCSIGFLTFEEMWSGLIVCRGAAPASG